MLVKAAAVLSFLTLAQTSAFAVEDKYNITPAEQAACSGDAVKLCSDSQDEDQLVTCMRSKRPALSRICLVTFDAGLRKRHMRL